MTQWIAFNELMDSPEVAAVCEKFFPLDSQSPDFVNKFMALTMLCSVAEPDDDLGADSAEYVGSGVCVFYAPELFEGERTNRWEPWTCELILGESLSFTFQPLADVQRLLNEDTGWRCTADGSKPGLEQLGWQQRTMDLLAASLWRPLNSLEEILAKRGAASEGSETAPAHQPAVG